MIKKKFRQMLLTQILSAMTVTICMMIDSIMIGRFRGLREHAFRRNSGGMRQDDGKRR